MKHQFELILSQDAKGKKHVLQCQHSTNITYYLCYKTTAFVLQSKRKQCENKIKTNLLEYNRVPVLQNKFDSKNEKLIKCNNLNNSGSSNTIFNKYLISSQHY